MKKFIFYQSEKMPISLCRHGLFPSSGKNKSISLGYWRTMATVLFAFLLCGSASFAQTQEDLRLQTSAYTPGKCPANDIQVVGATLVTADPCSTCTPGDELTANLKISVTNSTNSDRSFAILATLTETIGGVTKRTNISQCFDIVKKADNPGATIFDLGTKIFTCGSTITIEDILLVWTADVDLTTGGECPVTLKNNPNGKYCYANPVIVVAQPFNANPKSTCSATEVGMMDVALNIKGGSGDFSFKWSDDSILGDRTNIPIGTYTVTITDNKRMDANGKPCTIVLNIEAAQNCCINPNAGTDGSTLVCDSSTSAITLSDLITGEQSGGTWTRNTGGTGGTFNATAGTFTPAPGATTSTFTYTLLGTAPCINDSSVATVNINHQPNAGTDGNTLVCDSSTSAINLSDLIAGEETGGTWTRNLGGTGGTFNATAGTFTPESGATTSTFTYTLTGTTPCVNDSSVATVNINHQPYAGTDGNTLVCDSSTSAINLSDLITGEETGGTWTRNTGGTSGTFNATAGTFTPAPGAITSTFTYTLTGTAPCNNDTSVATVNINPTVTAGIGSPARYCLGAAGLTSIDLFARLDGEDAGGVWKNSANETVTSPINLSGSAAGAYTFTYFVTPVTGSLCPADDESVTITIDPLPVITCPEPQEIGVGCNVTAEAAQLATNKLFDDWVDTFAYDATKYSVEISYAYSPVSAEPASGVAPINPPPGSLPTVVTVTWTLTDINTNCKNSCSSTFTLSNGCRIQCTNSKTDVLCKGASTGTITVNGDGGATPYAVTLYKNGSTLVETKTGITDSPFTVTFQNLPALPAGEYYNYTVTDALYATTQEECDNEENILITEPASALNLSALGYTDVTCEGADTGTITANFSGGTSPYTLSIDGGTPFAATSPYTFIGVSAGSHTVNVYDANYATSPLAGCTDQERVEVGAMPCDDALCTYTQGAFGNSGGKYCDGTTGGITTAQLIKNAIDNAGGSITVGKLGIRSVTITGSDVACVISKLPGGGPAKELPLGDINICSTAIPTKKGRIDNVLLSQTITLALNINIKGTTELASFALQAGTLATAALAGACGTNEAKVRDCGECVNGIWVATVNEYTYRSFSQAVITASGGTNSTVAGLLDLANRALANVDGVTGTEDGVKLSDIAGAVGSINEVFDECRIPMGWSETRCDDAPTGGCPVTDNTSSFSLIKVYPNPFRDHINFEMKADVSAKASLQIYNLLGQKVFNVFDGYLEAGTTKVVQFNNAYNRNQSPLIYIYKIGENTYTGKLFKEE